MYEYDANIIRVVDADTVDAVVDLGFYVNVTWRFRIRNYDAPETWRPTNEQEAEHGRRATEFAKKLLVDRVVIRSYGLGIYARFSADIILPDGRDFATVMKEKGFSKLENY
jgi:micrococcal nuclease